MPPPRRLVRRRPLAERVKAYLNPLDFLLWISEELETSDWEQWQQDWSIPIGVVMNVVMMVCRANSGSRAVSEEEVFGEDYSRSGWLNWFAAFIVHSLSLLSFANAAYTFYRKRHYRLFEASIEEPPSTPSARRVKVDSSPMSSSPLRLLSSILQDNTAESRAHPDSQKDVWEISVWDPTPICLKMFCLFSPGHVLVYWLFLPTRPTDPRPSVTVAITIALAILLSVQLSLLQSNFSQSVKDTTLIHKEVFHEYDTKFVHPRTHPVMRDVGTQFSEEHDSFDGVDEYSPVTVVNRGFRTNPNPNYVGHVDPEVPNVRETPHRGFTTSSFTSQTPANLRDLASPLQQRPQLRQPGTRASMGPGDGRPSNLRASIGPDGRSSNFRSSVGPGDGGNLGVYSHAHSPLKKAASTHFPANQRLERVRGSPTRRESGRF